MAESIDKYDRFEDVTLRSSDNGGFILQYTGIYKPKSAKALDNVSRDWGRMMVFGETEGDKALEMLQKMADNKKK